MWGGVKVTVAPEALPLTTDDLRARLVLPLTGDPDQDAAEAMLLDVFQGQAVAMIEGPDGIGWAMSRQTWARTASGFSDLRGAFLLPGEPFGEVLSVEYLGADGVWADLDPAAFRVVDGLHPARLVPTGVWPSTSRGDGVVRVSYTVGPDAGVRPNAMLVAALSLMVGHYWENREAVVVGIQANEVPLGVDYILKRLSRVGAG